MARSWFDTLTMSGEEAFSLTMSVAEGLTMVDNVQLPRSWFDKLTMSGEEAFSLTMSGEEASSLILSLSKGERNRQGRSSCRQTSPRRVAEATDPGGSTAEGLILSGEGAFSLTMSVAEGLTMVDNVQLPRSWFDTLTMSGEGASLLTMSLSKLALSEAEGDERAMSPVHCLRDDLRHVLALTAFPFRR